MLSSKGAAGVTGAGFITLAATLSIVPGIPVEGMALILGIDRFMSECRSLTNFIGNAVATIVVARWDGALDEARLAAALDGGAPAAATPAIEYRTGSARSGTAGLKGEGTMRIRTLLLATAMGAASLATPAFGQATQPPGGSPDAPPTEALPVTPAEAAPDPDANNDVVVVGSQIRSSRVTEALPVTVLDRAQIDATGALTGDDLLRAIPQMGEVSFNPSNNPQTSNAARGDVNSINLRNLGTGNTLTLLNGRRLVSHPTSQAGEGNIPVLGPNANALPVAGIERLEILRDGASAIYGADAVAGVVNTVLRTDFDGLSLDGRYGWAEGTHREEWQITGLAGANFGGGRGNVTLYLDYTSRAAQLAEDQPYTATNNLLSLFADDPDFAGNLAADDRATQSPWANLAVVGGPGTIRRSPGNQALTSSAGAFHTQSIGNPGCLFTINAETCLGSGTRATATTLRSERFDNAIDTTVSPRIHRFNSFLSAHYDLSDSVTAYVEIGYYRASSHAVQPPVINLNAIVIPASNYWNPFGPVTFANGQANPNRIPDLTNVPAAGLPVRLTTYRFVDTGPQNVDVTNWQSRFLGGLRGSLGGSWDFDTALLYSEAQATDVSPNDRHDRAAAQPRSVDAGRLQSIQRRLQRDPVDQRLHAVVAGRDRLDRVRAQAAVADDARPRRLQALQR